MAGANWQRGGGKGVRPKPVPLPSDKKPGRMKPAGSEALQRLRNLGLLNADNTPALPAPQPAEQPPASD